jgi:hypothetical protein
MPEPRDAATITQGRDDGWHGAWPRVERMTPTSHVWTIAVIVFLLRKGLGSDYSLLPYAL